MVDQTIYHLEFPNTGRKYYICILAILVNIRIEKFYLRNAFVFKIM